MTPPGANTREFLREQLPVIASLVVLGIVAAFLQPRLPSRRRRGVSTCRSTRAVVAPVLDGILDRVHDGAGRGSRRNLRASLFDVGSPILQFACNADHPARHLSQSLGSAVRLPPQPAVAPWLRLMGLLRRGGRRTGRPLRAAGAAVGRRTVSPCGGSRARSCGDSSVHGRVARLLRSPETGRDRAQVRARSGGPEGGRALPGGDPFRSGHRDGGARGRKADHWLLGRVLDRGPALPVCHRLPWWARSRPRSGSEAGFSSCRSFRSATGCQCMCSLRRRSPT